VLFSKDSVAGFINASFEPTWVSVRPVPIVRIDFGDGNVMTRTLHGNILTSVCTSDGLILDSLPGIYTEDVYRDRLNQLRLLAQYAGKRPVKDRAAIVRAYHPNAAVALTKGEAPDQFAEKISATAYVSKLKVENPIEVVLVKGTATTPTPKKAEPGKASTDVAGWKELVEDTTLNESTRRRQIHEMLAKAGLVRPEKVLKPLYKDVLHADLDDPYLGLGKTLFASYPFEKEDRRAP
jgi:hypothetical protein